MTRNTRLIMNIMYQTPATEQIPFLVERQICATSNMTSGGDYNPYPDDFDEDSD